MYRARANYLKANANTVRILSSAQPEYRVNIRGFSNYYDPFTDPDATRILTYGDDGNISGSITEFYDLGILLETLQVHNAVINQISPEATKARASIRSALQVDPTLGSNPPPISLPISSVPPDSAAFSGVDRATFLQDVTIPDDSVTSPGQNLTKTWRMRNSGTSTWGNGYQLAFVSGNQMGGPVAVNIPTTAPNATADISVNLAAPNQSGTHTGYWQLRNAQGTFFGDRLWIRVVVPIENVSQSPSSPPIELHCVDCPARVTPGQKFRPIIQARVNSGQLMGGNLRGDLLRHKSGPRFGAYEFVAVAGNTVVNPGQTYTFQFYENDPITAPTQPGIYERIKQIHFCKNEKSRCMAWQR